jgi:hypothetical protein
MLESSSLLSTAQEIKAVQEGRQSGDVSSFLREVMS